MNFSKYRYKLLFCFVSTLFCGALSMSAQDIEMVGVKPSKEAVKEAKKLQKEGWTCSGKMSMAQMVEMGYQLAMVPSAETLGTATSRYIIANSQENGMRMEIARNKAVANCEAQISQVLNTEIAGIIRREMTNFQTSTTEAETTEHVSSMVGAASSASLKKCFVVWEMLKKENDGSVSVLMQMALDRNNIKILNDK